MSRAGTVYDTLVVGGGVMGLATLYHLSRLGRTPIGLVEQFRVGHRRGSSHGQARITRSTYHHPVYVRLMQQAHEVEWPRLERAAGVRLIRRASGVFFGPQGGLIAEYKSAVADAGAEVQELGIDEARRRFPQFRFPSGTAVLLDQTGGIVFARETVRALLRLCREAGAAIMEDCAVTEIDAEGDPIAVHTERGEVSTARLVVTGGAWSGRLVPMIAERLDVVRQHVCYFDTPNERHLFEAEHFPVWAYIGERENVVYYGMPRLGSGGLKAARYVTRSQSPGRGGDDPDAEGQPDDAEIERVADFLGRELAVPVGPLREAETCLFTNTAREDFLIDLLPGDPRIAIGAGFSGHGFKFAPLTGRALAELVTAGRSAIPGFEESRGLFAI